MQAICCEIISADDIAIGEVARYKKLAWMFGYT